MPDLQTLFIWIIPVLFAITIPVTAKGWIAAKLGDHTAWMMGRVTLNPVKHIDPVGTILVPAVLLLMILIPAIQSPGIIFGWAKRVPINYDALRSPKSGMMWVALAGPVANLIMAIGWLLIFFLATNMNILILQRMADAGILINILLAIFNLLPIPPLDGSRVISALLPNPLAYKYNQLEQYGFVILIGLMWFGGFSYIVLPIIRLVLSWFRYFQALI